MTAGTASDHDRQMIVDVVARLDWIVAESRNANSRLGYFPALYGQVSRQALAAYDAQRFHQPKLAAQLIARFARRYLDALDAWRAGGDCTEPWQVAFAAADRWRPTVIQHLLVGINAHINLDLGIAAVETVGDGPLEPLRSDFDRVNELLFDLIDPVQAALADVWWMLRLLDWFAAQIDEWLIGTGLIAARREAWGFAVDLASAEPARRSTLIKHRARKVAEIGRRILTPGFIPTTLLLVVRLGERQNPAGVIDLLSNLERPRARAAEILDLRS